MRISVLRLRNWMRFEGEHSIAFGDGVHAVTAEHDVDARRSNWMGKTSLLEAMRFALFGTHRFPREDDWITHGEQEGIVTLALDDGLTIQRSRRRGQSTKLEVRANDEVATGDAAQKVVEQIIGLSSKDFDVSCWFGQKQLSRLVTAKPAERMELVSGWLALDGLQACEERVRLRLSDMTTRQAHAQQTLLGVERAVLQVTQRRGFGEGLLEELEAEEARVLASKVEATTALADAKALEADAAKLRAIRANAREYVGIIEQGKKLRDEIGKADGDATAAAQSEAQHAVATKAMMTAGDELRRKKQLALGEFDGVCPVGGIKCPATDQLNGQRRTNAGLVRTAQVTYDDACRAEAIARSTRNEFTTKAAERQRLIGQRDALRARAETLKPAYDQAKERQGEPDAEDGTAIAEAEQNLRRIVVDLGVLRADIDAAKKFAEEAAEIRSTLEKIQVETGIARAALRIFGRQGAQRAVAEDALGQIQEDANALLRASGIDLVVGVKWAREGAGLATSCEECGAPFPSSTRVKACERCEAPRGPKLIERLDIELSDRSGAAEDIAGAALQLAATAWLRRERGTPWSVAFIDEPFGALDEANRIAFGRQLAGMLRGRFGFEQAFIISHTPDTTDLFPNRVTVRGDEYGSAVAS